MNNEQIIIDGVDVSECEHYDNVCLGNHHYKYCKDNENCYYKQLKRKEQECEELASKCSQLKQTLVEIKEIATCCIEGDVARIRMKQILQKINEVENEP